MDRDHHNKSNSIQGSLQQEVEKYWYVVACVCTFIFVSSLYAQCITRVCVCVVVFVEGRIQCWVFSSVYLH